MNAKIDPQVNAMLGSKRILKCLECDGVNFKIFKEQESDEGWLVCYRCGHVTELDMSGQSITDRIRN